MGFQARVAVQEGREERSGQPVVVVERHRVKDVSEAAASLGVWMGQTVRAARHAAPSAKYAEIDRAGLGELEREFGDRCLSVTPWVEPVGPGEVYLDLRWAGDWRGTIDGLLASFVPALGWRVYAGVAAGKGLARSVTRLVMERPPRTGDLRGVYKTEIVPGTERTFLRNLPLRNLTFLPEGFEEDLGRLGVRTAGELLEIPETSLLTKFGGRGALARAAALGLDGRRVATAYPPGQITEELSVPEELEGDATLAAVPALAKRVAAGLAAKLQAQGKGCLYLEVFLLPMGRRLYRRFAAKPWHQQDELARTLEGLLTEVLRQERRPSLESVLATARELVTPRVQQLELFAATGPARGANTLGGGGRDGLTAVMGGGGRPVGFGLEKAIASINLKFPGHPVKLGKEFTEPRRERMLALYDPYRSKAVSGKGPPAAPGD